MKILFLFLAILVSFQANSRPASTWVYNETKQELVSADHANVTRPIASLTKVMTALVALEHDSDMSKLVPNTSGTRLPPGANTRGDLFSSMMVRSDNQAAELLARNYPGGRKAFIKAMNDRAQSLGMVSARFVDPSGLRSGNVATVGEIATLIQVAALQPILADTSVLKQVEIKNKKYKVILDNTNKMLLAAFDEIKFSKTGFTTPAGWSVGVVLERHNQRFIVVVLGARDKVHRYNLAKELIHKHFAEIEHTAILEQPEISIWEKTLDQLFGTD